MKKWYSPDMGHPWRFMILSLVSLLLFAATCVLWVRSYFVEDRLRRAFDRHRLLEVDSYRGAFLVKRDDLDADSVIADMFPALIWDNESITPERGYGENGDSMDSVSWRKARYLGFGFGRSSFFEGIQYSVVVPFWSVAALTALMPASLIHRWFGRRRRQKRSVCVKCGYDLRATRDRCPECGTTLEFDGVPMPPA